MKGQLMMTYYVEEGTILTGKDCPVPAQEFAGLIDCPHCKNPQASVLRDADDPYRLFKTDCGDCDHYFPVTVVELNKYSYAYLKNIEFSDPELIMEWSQYSFTEDEYRESLCEHHLMSII